MGKTYAEHDQNPWTAVGGAMNRCQSVSCYGLPSLLFPLISGNNQKWFGREVLESGQISAPWIDNPAAAVREIELIYSKAPQSQWSFKRVHSSHPFPHRLPLIFKSCLVRLKIKYLELDRPGIQIPTLLLVSVIWGKLRNLSEPEFLLLINGDYTIFCLFQICFSGLKFAFGSPLQFFFLVEIGSIFTFIVSILPSHP